MKNKIISILSIIIICLFILTTNIFAYSEEFIYNDINYTYYIPDGAYNSFLESEQYKSGEYNYLLSCDNGTCRIYFWLKTQDVKIYQTTKANYYNSNISDYGCLYYTVSENGGTLNLQDSNATSFHNSSHCSGNTIYMYTNVNVYTDSSCTDFFFKAPVMEITLAQELEKIQVQEMWKTLMKNVVVSLVVFLVGLIAFLKAWNWLKTQLHKA